MTGPDIFAPSFAADPYPHYAAMRTHHPLYQHPQTGAWILSRHADVTEALTNPDFTTASYAAQIEPLLGVTVVQRDGAEHARERRLLAAPFQPARVQSLFADAIAAQATALIETFRHKGEADLVADFIAAYPVGILALVLGLPQSDRDTFRTWYTSLLRFGLNLTGDPEIARAGLEARDALAAYLAPLVAAARAGQGTGLLAMLATGESGDSLTDDDIIRFGMLMVFAGGETVEKTTATFLRNLLAHPETLAEIRQNRTLLETALAESLRYTAPTHMVPRQTRADVQVSGGTIPSGAEVICFLGSANRDESRFAQADTYNIHRTDLDSPRAFTAAATHTAFGAGRHFCLGAPLARVEVLTAVNLLLDALPDLALVGLPPGDQGLFLRGPASLPVRFST
jgi:pulcherriminic acid synthase